MPTKKKSGSSEEGQEKPKTTKPKAKKTVAKKKTSAKTEMSDVGFDQEFQPLVYNQAEEKPVIKDAPKAPSTSSVAPAAYAAPLSKQPMAAPMMDSAKTATPTAPLSAASLHKQPMAAPMAPMAAVPAKVNDAEIIRDIKPRENPKDAAFLAPDKYGFDLKKNSGSAGRGKWVNILIYSLSTLIILLTILLFALTFYSGKMVKNSDSDLSGQDNTEQTTTTDNSTGQVATGYSFTITNLPADLQDALIGLVKTEFKDSSITVSNDNANLKLPEVKADTIFVKQANQPQTKTLMDMLAKYGIKPEIQQKEDLPVAASLFFVTTLAKPDLSGLTSTVYNATGTGGLAKQYCATLTSFKVSNCQALNATANQTGTTIVYKNVKAFFTLKRTSNFATAKFSAAPITQIEDIKVTVGK